VDDYPYAVRSKSGNTTRGERRGTAQRDGRKALGVHHRTGHQDNAVEPRKRGRAQRCRTHRSADGSPATWHAQRSVSKVDRGRRPAGRRLRTCSPIPVRHAGIDGSGRSGHALPRARPAEPRRPLRHAHADRPPRTPYQKRSSSSGGPAHRLAALRQARVASKSRGSDGRHSGSRRRSTGRPPCPQCSGEEPVPARKATRSKATLAKLAELFRCPVRTRRTARP